MRSNQKGASNLLSGQKSDPGSVSAFHMITTDLIQTDGSEKLLI